MPIGHNTGQCNFRKIYYPRMSLAVSSFIPQGEQIDCLHWPENTTKYKLDLLRSLTAQYC